MQKPDPRLHESSTAMQRLGAAALIGLAAFGISVIFASWQFSIVIGYDVAAATLVGSVLVLVGRFDATRTRASATREDNGRFATQVLLLGASVASLVAVGLELSEAAGATGARKAILMTFGVATVFLSWTVVHSVYALRYAHLYYMPPEGGIDFKCDDAPDYRDFAYVAFTVGMTFQVADTDLQAPQMRHTVLRHALLSYLFGAVILAVLINSIASVF